MNIVFDLGGVVFDWRPDKIIRSLFTDDMSENLVAVASTGIQTIKFVDPAQCKQALIDLGCIE